MNKTITIGTREVALGRSAALPIFYRKIFKSDIHKDFSDLVDGAENGLETIQQITYIMYLHTQGMDAMSKANYDTYIQWLCQFDVWDFQSGDTIADIVTYYADGAERIENEETKEQENKSTKKKKKPELTVIE